ncbi:hypothetical protein B0H14DRAFT_3879469 [Mycena olivaceomarginata]|nr:hypothetical protein B0H14DRAFT_3879469 [Mycena olivaceomarginata]
MPYTLSSSGLTNAISPTAHSIARPAAPNGVPRCCHLFDLRARLPAPPRLRPYALIWQCVAPSSVAAAAIKTATSLARLETPPAMPRRQLYRSHSSPPSCLEAGPRRTPLKRRRVQWSWSHCVYGLGLPACAANPIASIVFHHLLWCRPERNTRERTYRNPRRFPIPPRSRCTVSYLRPVSASAHARIIGAARPPFNRNSRKYVQHRIRALGPTPLEACSSTISLAMCEMLAILRAHVRISNSEALKNQEGVSSHSRPSLATSPSIQQSRASSDAPRRLLRAADPPPRWSVAYDVRRDQHGRSLPGGPSKAPPQRA